MAGLDGGAVGMAAALGAFHGLNPAMGWLFAVFLALQRQSPRTLGRALAAVALGHTVAVAAVALAVGLASRWVPAGALRLASALAVLAFGAYRLAAWYRHPRWASLNVTYGALFVWSFLVATAHGSGVMLAPLFAWSPEAPRAFALVAAHLAAMVTTMALSAGLVFYRLGPGVLRRLWPNFDLLWGGALVLAGAVALWASTTPV